MTKDGPLCHKCPLKDAAGPIWGIGPPSAKLIIVGMCPGPDEIRAGEPFVGSSGRILNNALYRAGLPRESAFITNTVKCFVSPGQLLPREAVDCCRPLLEKEMDVVPNAKVILTLGGEAFHAFSGKKLTTVTNRKKPDAWLRGCPYHMGRSRTIIPAVHPAFLARTGFRDSIYFDADLAKTKRWVEGKGIRYEERLNYTPTPSEVTEYVKECQAKGEFGVDIETPESVLDEEDITGRGPTNIQVVGISAEIGECVGVPPDLLPLLKPLFGDQRERLTTMYDFNHGFDGYHLSTHFPMVGVRPFDVMLALHCVYSDLRPKDLGMALSFWTDMPYTKNLAKIDPQRYNAADTYGALWAGRTAQVRLHELGLEKLFWEHNMALWPAVEQMKLIGVNCDVRQAMLMELTMNRTLESYEQWWSEHIPLIDWQSPKQLLSFFAVQKLPVVYRNRIGKDKKVKKTPSVDEDVLELYRDKYDNKIANLILVMRKLKKASDFTHVYSSDGRSHAQYKIHGQTGGRIQAKDPDLQNIPEELSGIKPRTIFVPDSPQDDVFIVADFEQIEFWLYAHFAQDKPLLEAKKAGTYVYGIFYEEFFKEPFFEAGKPRIKAYRRKDISPSKLLIAKSYPLGFVYGRGKKDGGKYFEQFHSAHPAIAQFHSRITAEARRQGFLRNAFGRIRWFPNVDSMRNELLAFPGQSNAVDILIRNAILPLSEGLRNYNARLLLTVHDSVGISAPRSSLGGVVDFIQECMERPIPELGGFWIPAAISVSTKEISSTGKANWGDVIPYADWVTQQPRAAYSLPSVSERADGQVKSTE